MTGNRFVLVLMGILMGSSATGSPVEATSVGGSGSGPSIYAPIAGLPMGLDCGVVYVVDPIVGPVYGRDTCDTSQYQSVFDGDLGARSSAGFRHRELVAGSSMVTDLSQSTLFKLPQGTACGFHHTGNSWGHKCMNLDPWTDGCPNGWTRQISRDATSNYYWAWCEYQDPNHFCTDLTCINNGPPGVVCGIADVHDGGTYGTCAGVLTATACPTGWTRWGFYDAGRSSNQGLGWCAPPN